MDNIIDFLEKEVNYFNDGIIRGFNIDFNQDSIRVIISTDSNQGWINVEITCIDIDEFCIKQPLNYKNDVVLSSGIHISKIENTYYFDFSGQNASIPENIEQYRSSKFYIACRKHSITKKEYEE